MLVQRWTSRSMMARYSRSAGSPAPETSASRPSPAATQAAMVASGLLISCMIPAASCPTAASFSLWRMCACTSRHSETSSPMVMTWVIASPPARIGMRVSR